MRRATKPSSASVRPAVTNTTRAHANSPLSTRMTNKGTSAMRSIVSWFATVKMGSAMSLVGSVALVEK